MPKPDCWDHHILRRLFDGSRRGMANQSKAHRHAGSGGNRACDRREPLAIQSVDALLRIERQPAQAKRHLS